MKTNAYSPPPPPPPTRSEDFPLDLPCLMWAGSQDPVGPYPLAVCLLKAVELARLKGASFAIRGHASMKTILTLKNQVVDGELSVQRVFKAQVALAESLFAAIAAEARSAALREVAEKQPSDPRLPKKSKEA